ncbi:SWEET sugar transporter [Babesia duncani]|uniref:SWEET sugar transporter n=1 Tax=Babesia duncani TaxID=323732 RepID=A0AAD9PNZ7_9APIC|nr:SWEET sugar transporter [Babesia duncani]
MHARRDIFYNVFFISVGVVAIMYLSMSAEWLLMLVGLSGGVVLTISYMTPLLSIKEIVRSRNTSTMPAEISLAQFFGSFFMLCYGFLIWDYLVIIPNFCGTPIISHIKALGMIAGMIQITLIVLFPQSDRIIVSEAGILEIPGNFKPALRADANI